MTSRLEFGNGGKYSVSGNNIYRFIKAKEIENN